MFDKRLNDMRVVNPGKEGSIPRPVWRKKDAETKKGGEGQMTVTRPVVKTGTIKKKIHPAWVLALPWKVAKSKGGTLTVAQGKGSRWRAQQLNLCDPAWCHKMTGSGNQKHVRITIDPDWKQTVQIVKCNGWLARVASLLQTQKK